MDDAVKRFRQRRSARLGFGTIKHYDSVQEYRKRRAARLAARMDADGDEETTPAPKKGGGGHGNTKIPFGLCQREGIEIQPGWTPEDAWKALEGKGYSAGEAYKELKETGKVSKKGSGSKTGPGQKDYSAMDYDTLVKEFADHAERYKQRGKDNDANKRKAQDMENALGTLKKLKEHDDYSGESLEEAKQKEEEAWNGGDSTKDYYKYRAIRKTLELLGEDAFEEDYDEVEKRTREKAEELSTPQGYGDLNQEREAVLKALAAKAKEKYPKITDCDTPLALESRLRADDFYESSEWSSMRMDYSEMDAANVSGVAKGLSILEKKFPKLKGMLPPPMMADINGNVYAHVKNYDSEHPELELNTRFFHYNTVGNNLKDDVKSGFHPKGTGSIQGTVTHEYGHVIDGILSRKFKDELGGKGFSAYVLDRIAKNHSGESKGSIMESVSRYCVNNDAEEGIEFLAEAFSEYCCSSKPRPIAKEVGQIMTEFIKRL